MFDFTLVARAGLTQKEFASLAAVTRPTVVAWIHGRHQPSVRRHARLERVMSLLQDWADERPLDKLPEKQRKAVLLEAEQNISQ